MKLWNRKTILKASLVAAVVGLVLAAMGFVLGAEYRGLYWDSGPRIIRQEDVTEIRHEISSIRNIHMDAAFGDIELVSSDRYAIALTGIKDEWEWAVNGDTLEITQRDRNSSGFQIYGAFSATPRKAIVYLPQNVELSNISISVDSGDVTAGSFRAGSTMIESNFGSVSLRDISSDTLEVYLDSGDLHCINTAAGSLRFDSDFGSGRFENITSSSFTSTCDSGDLDFINTALGRTDIQMNFGSLQATSVSTNGLTMNADSGDVDISGELLGKTVITNNFGSVYLHPLQSAAAYAYQLETDFGDVEINGKDMGSRASDQNTGAPNSLDVQCDSGDIEVSFGA